MNLVTSQQLTNKLFHEDIEMAPIRKGFGEGLLAAGEVDTTIVALCADLTESTQMEAFAQAFPERYVEIGVAEQNLVTVASGLASVGKKPFVTSYAGFSPGRNWEQIRTTICLNQQNVKIVGSHAGVSVGPDGATHQMLEDIALMRVLPNMVVVVPCDANEARKATLALAKTKTPAYLRLARDKTTVVTTEQSPFEIGRANVLCEGCDLTIVACGPLVYEALLAAKKLLPKYSIEVINCHTVKPLDDKTILKSVKKTGCVLSVEEAQSAGGMGGAIAELLSDKLPVPLKRIGVQDNFGQSGTVAELWQHYKLDAEAIASTARGLIK